MKKITLTLAILLSFAIQAQAQVDPCLNTSRLQSVFLSLAPSATEIVTNTATDQGILICGYTVTFSTPTSGSNFAIYYGTGAVCVTGQTNLTIHQVDITASTTVTIPITSNHIPIAKIPPAKNLCVSVTGATSALRGVLSYVVF